MFLISGISRGSGLSQKDERNSAKKMLNQHYTCIYIYKRIKRNWLRKLIAMTSYSIGANMISILYIVKWGLLEHIEMYTC